MQHIWSYLCATSRKNLPILPLGWSGHNQTADAAQGGETRPHIDLPQPGPQSVKGEQPRTRALPANLAAQTSLLFVPNVFDAPQGRETGTRERVDHRGCVDAAKVETRAYQPDSRY
jgi:hypothetical protein